MSELTPYTIDKFLGVNRSETETLLQLGEASYMSNWIITDDNKLQKMFGYAHLFDTLGAHKINGMWYGQLGDTNYFVFACNGHVYELDMETNGYTDLGTVTDAYPTTFFASNNTLYILDGTEFYSWTGTGSISEVTGYVPTVFTSALPTGGGTLLEKINYINGQKIQKFSANGSATVYQLAELDIDSVDSVVVNGVTKTPTTDYTVNLENGTVTFLAPPAEGVNNVVITWTKTVSGDRETITKNNYYGGVYYARFWLFGNPDHKNTRYCSGVTTAGVSDPTYWPKFTDSDVGEHEISDITTQYNKQLIFTAGDSSGASAWYSEEELYTDPSTNIVTTLFPTHPMNTKIGNVAKGQVQIIVNNPFTIHKGVYRWSSTYVLNEKDAEWMSKRVQPDLDDVDLTKAITYDWSDKGWYLLCIDKRIWVYNYRVDVWYVLDLAHTPTCFIVVNQELYFGTDNGQIMKFDESLNTYDGTTINAVWKMGFFNFGVDWLRKYIQRIFISILPRLRTHIDVTYQTDKGGMSETVTASYALTTFEHANFAHWTFKTNYSPQPFKFKVRAKKIDYFKIVITNNDTDTATVLSITLPTRIGGEVKNRS